VPATPAQTATTLSLTLTFATPMAMAMGLAPFDLYISCASPPPSNNGKQLQIHQPRYRRAALHGAGPSCRRRCAGRARASLIRTALSKARAAIDDDSSGAVIAARQAADKRGFHLLSRSHCACRGRGAVRRIVLRLTTRERDVLRFLAAGLNSKDIAAELKIGVRTVEGYRVSIMDKIGIRHIPGLVKYAILQQLTPLE
jgi:DNA-binding CsgD family transcriptional regulator